MLAVAAIAALTAAQAWAQDDSAKKVRFQPFEATGYQADSSSPLVFHGTPIGNNAIWQVQVGPIESSPFATIPSVSGFGGAECVADYSQAELVAEDGSTLTVNVYGTRCEPNDLPAAGTPTASGAHVKHGVYSVVGGTGAFQNTRGGTGSISFDAPGNGSVYVNVTGFLRYPANPI